MEQLLAHLLGDYVLQNHWMANNKTREWLPALVHVLLYGLPFLLLTQSSVALTVIVLTHLVIDRFRLAQHWVDFWGTGKAGWLPSQVSYALRGQVYVNTGTRHTPLAKRIPDAPPFLGVWLLIIVDNTMHLCINYAALRWL